MPVTREDVHLLDDPPEYDPNKFGVSHDKSKSSNYFQRAEPSDGANGSGLARGEDSARPTNHIFAKQSDNPAEYEGWVEYFNERIVSAPQTNDLIIPLLPVYQFEIIEKRY